MQTGNVVTYAMDHNFTSISIHKTFGLYLIEDDFSDEPSEESEDEISMKMGSISNVYHDTSDGFDLGIDCSEVARGISLQQLNI